MQGTLQRNDSLAKQKWLDYTAKKTSTKGKFAERW